MKCNIFHIYIGLKEVTNSVDILMLVVLSILKA